jgi:hypothetical protein
MSGLIPAYGWNFELTLAMNEYPIPWLKPRIGALLGIVLQVFGGSCVLLAFATRAGAFATLLLNVATPLYYVPLDVDLFRSMFAAGLSSADQAAVVGSSPLRRLVAQLHTIRRGDNTLFRRSARRVLVA